MKIITFGNFKGGTGKSSLAGLRSVDELLKEMIEVYKNDKATEESISN